MTNLYLLTQRTGHEGNEVIVGYARDLNTAKEEALRLSKKNGAGTRIFKNLGVVPGNSLKYKAGY